MMEILDVNIGHLVEEDARSFVKQTNKCVAVAEPDNFFRERMTSTHHIYLTPDLTQKLTSIEDFEEILEDFLNGDPKENKYTSVNYTITPLAGVDEDWIGHVKIRYQTERAIPLDWTINSIGKFFERF